MNYSIILSIIFLLVGIDLQSQQCNTAEFMKKLDNANNQNLTKADACRALTKCFVANKQYTAALNYALRELEIVSEMNDNDTLVERKATIYFNLASISRRTSNYQWSIKYAKKGLCCYQKLKDSLGLADMYIMLAQTNYLSANYKGAIAYIKQLHKLNQSGQSRYLTTADSIDLLILEGSIAIQNGRYDSAEYYFEKAAQQRHSTAAITPVQLCRIYNNLGSIKLEKNLVHVGIFYFSKVLEIARHNEMKFMYNFKLIYTNLGFCYYRLGNYAQALRLHQKSINLLNKLYNQPNEHLAFAYNHMGGTYLQMQLVDSAFFYINESIQIYTKLMGPQSSAVINPIWKKAKVYLHNNQFVRAEASYLQLIPLQIQYFGLQNPDLARMYYDLSIICRHLKENKKATLYNHKAWESNIVEGKVLDPLLMISILKQQLVITSFQENKNNVYPHKKIEMMGQLINSNLQQMLSLEDSKELLEGVNTICAYSIDFLYKNYTLTRNSNHIHRIFDMMEYHKSVLLALHIKLQHVNSPKSVLRNKVAGLEKKWMGNYRKYKSFEFDNQNQQLFDLYWEAEFLNKETTTNHFINLATLQSTLNKNESALHYFWGKKHIYRLLIEQQKLRLDTIPKSVEKLIHQFRDACSRHPVKADDDDWRTYEDLAYRLYLQLGLQDSKEQLIIIPDKQLDALPFAALCFQPKPNSKGFHDLHYLIKKHKIRYAYSANTLFMQQNRPRQTINNTILGLAPKYHNNSLLSPILYNQEEIKYLQSKFRGQFLFDTAVHKAGFLRYCTGHHVIHIAAHGSANVKQERDNVLYLCADSSNENCYLYPEDILSQALATELVVLNACNSGNGYWIEGEGSMSIGRDFMYAGARSVLQTSWEIDDFSSLIILKDFYKHLHKSPKQNALHKAMNNYIKQASMQEAHPYYWASYQLYGSPVALQVQIGRTEKKWYLAAFILGGLFILYFLYHYFR